MSNDSKFKTKLVKLIGKLQERLTRVDNQTSANTEQLVIAAGKIKTLEEETSRAWALNAALAANEVKAMYALRESVQKAFTRVAADIDSLRTRASEAEDKSSLTPVAETVYNNLNHLEARIYKIEQEHEFVQSKEKPVEQSGKNFLKVLPVLIKLMDNPDFVAKLAESGYRFDAAAIFKAFTDAAGWKFNTDILRKVG